MRPIGIAAVALAALLVAGDRDGARPRDVPLAALSVPFLASADDEGVAAFSAWTVAGPAVVTRDGALVYAIADPWRKASSRASAPLVVTERFAGATPLPRAGERSSTGVSVLREAPAGRTSVDAFDSVELGEAWPGIRVTLRARARSIEKVFVVAPGASPDAIRVALDGVDALRVDADGRLVAAAAGGEIAFSAPLAWQDGWLGRSRIAVAYAPDGLGYGFVVGPFDRARPLVIDPRLEAAPAALPQPRAS